MALNNKPQDLEEKTRFNFRNPELKSNPEEEDLEKLESDVKQLAEKVAEYRATLPDQLKNTLTSILSEHRAVLPRTATGSESGPSGEENPGHFQSIKGSQQMHIELKDAEKMRLFEDKLSSNISAIPIIVKRMKDCIARIDKLDSSSGTIHPAFRKKPTS